MKQSRWAGQKTKEKPEKREKTEDLSAKSKKLCKNSESCFRN